MLHWFLLLFLSERFFSQHLLFLWQKIILDDYPEYLVMVFPTPSKD